MPGNSRIHQFGTLGQGCRGSDLQCLELLPWRSVGAARCLKGVPALEKRLPEPLLLLERYGEMTATD